MQFILMIGFVLVEREGQGEVDGYSPKLPCICRAVGSRVFRGEGGLGIENGSKKLCLKFPVLAPSRSRNRTKQKYPSPIKFMRYTIAI